MPHDLIPGHVYLFNPIHRGHGDLDMGDVRVAYTNPYMTEVHELKGLHVFEVIDDRSVEKGMLIACLPREVKPEAWPCAMVP